MLDLLDVILNRTIHRHPLQVSHWSSAHRHFAFPRCVSFHLACFIECFLACFDRHVVDGLLFCTPHVSSLCVHCIELFGNPLSYTIATVARDCNDYNVHTAVMSPFFLHLMTEVQVEFKSLHICGNHLTRVKIRAHVHFSIMLPWSSALLASTRFFPHIRAQASKMQGCLKVNSGQNSAESCQNEHYLMVARLPAWE